jgi:hypothetical protein
MRYAITEAIACPDHTVTVTWSDGISATVSFAPCLEKGGLFDALKDPEYFTREMRMLPGGIGLAWPNEVDFSADGLRESAFPNPYVVINPLPPSRIEWLRQQSLRVAAVFRAQRKPPR